MVCFARETSEMRRWADGQMGRMNLHLRLRARARAGVGSAGHCTVRCPLSAVTDGDCRECQKTRRACWRGDR